MFLGVDVEEMIENIVDKVAIGIADTSTPHVLYQHPAMQLVLTEVAEFRAETNAAALQRLLNRLKSEKLITDRIESIAERFINVSIDSISLF